MLAAGVVYLLAVWLDAIGTGLPNGLLPRAVRFFVQEAALFPHAATEVVEWRVEGWMCSEQRFAEIDVRPFFLIRRDDKESRFYRAMFFHHRERKVMRALDEYIVRKQNSADPERRIGGVLLLSLRVPIPAPGSAEPRYQRLPLSSFLPAIERNHWYTTGRAERDRSCTEPP
jgi:hypothetical protein